MRPYVLLVREYWIRPQNEHLMVAYYNKKVRFELQSSASIVFVHLNMQVAAIGMDPQKHLGKDLASVQPHLTRLARYLSS